MLTDDLLVDARHYIETMRAKTPVKDTFSEVCDRLESYAGALRHIRSMFEPGWKLKDLMGGLDDE